MALDVAMPVPTPSRSLRLKESTCLYGQGVQSHLEFRDGRTDFWMLSDFVLQSLQDLLSTCNMRSRFGWIWLGIGLAW